MIRFGGVGGKEFNQACAFVAFLAVPLMGCAPQGLQPGPPLQGNPHSLVPVASGFVLCCNSTRPWQDRKSDTQPTDGGAFLLNGLEGLEGREFTTHRIASGDVCAADKEGYVLTSRYANGISELRLYRLNKGAINEIGMLRTRGVVKDIVPATCFAPYRFAVNVFEPKHPSGFVTSRVSLVRIESEASGEEPVPILSGMTTLTRPWGLLFSEVKTSPGMVASTLMSGPGWRVAQDVPGIDERGLMSAYLLLISGDRLVRGWCLGGPASGTPLAYSADGKFALVRAAGVYQVVDTNTGKVEEEPNLNLPPAMHVLAADVNLGNLVAIERNGVFRNGVFWVNQRRERKPLFESAGPLVATFVGERAVVTDGKSIWIVGAEGVEIQGALAPDRTGR